MPAKMTASAAFRLRSFPSPLPSLPPPASWICRKQRDGGLVAGGLFTGTQDFGCGPLTATPAASFYLVRLNASTGACVWSRTIPGETLDDFGDRHIHLDQAGDDHR